MIALTCPSCAKKLQVKDESAGKKVKCPKCGELIKVPVPEIPEEIEELEEMEEAPPPPVSKSKKPLPSRSKPQPEEDEEEPPRRGKKGPPEKPGRNLSRKKSYADEDDDDLDSLDEDEEDRPRSRSSKRGASAKDKGPPGKAPSVLWMLLAIILFLGGLGASCLGAYLYFDNLEIYKRNEQVITDKKNRIASLEKEKDLVVQVQIPFLRKEVASLEREQQENKQIVDNYLYVAIGGVVGIILSVFLLGFYFRRKSRSKKSQDDVDDDDVDEEDD
jgi:predicted Zn finger-like uncharacterized protein